MLFRTAILSDICESGGWVVVYCDPRILAVKPSASVLVRELGEEVSIKSDASSRHIGFLS